MTNEDILDKKIEDYLHNRLTDAERSLFEKSLYSDQLLKDRVFDLITLKSLYDKELFELKKKLEAAADKLDARKFFEDSPNME